jgi:hypothetical protein
MGAHGRPLAAVGGQAVGVEQGIRERALSCCRSVMLGATRQRSRTWFQDHMAWFESQLGHFLPGHFCAPHLPGLGLSFLTYQMVRTASPPALRPVQCLL